MATSTIVAIVFLSLIAVGGVIAAVHFVREGEGEIVAFAAIIAVLALVCFGVRFSVGEVSKNFFEKHPCCEESVDFQYNSFCVNCGNGLCEDDKFCPDCGNSVTSEKR